MKAAKVLWVAVFSALLALPMFAFSQDERDDPEQRGQDESANEAPPAAELEATPEEPPQVGAFNTNPPSRWQPPRVTQGWSLGVKYADAPLGIRITRVERNTAAADLGLEAGDYIMAAGGYPVGYYKGRYYPLSDVLDRYADRRGTIRLRF